MNRFFGKPKKEAPRQEEEPVDFSALSEHQTNIENKIDQYQQRLNGIMEEIRKQSELLKTTKGFQYNMVLSHLRNLLQQKKQCENQLNQYCNMGRSVSATCNAIENMQMQQEQLKVTEQAVNLMKKTFNPANVVKMESMADKLADLREQQEELNDIMCQDYTSSIDADIDNDLAEIESEIAASQTYAIPQAYNNPIGTATFAQPQTQTQNPVSVPMGNVPFNQFN